MMTYSNSSFQETSYSFDERFDHQLELEREIENRRKFELDLERRTHYKTLNSHRDLPIFNHGGLEFLAFRHDRIKFRFVPTSLTRFVRKGVAFYVSLKYRGRNWRIKRDSLPVNLKVPVYALFYNAKGFAINDDNIAGLIERIYELLFKWTLEHQEFRIAKHRQYKSGQIEDLELDSDDEQIFLTLDERVKLFQKRGKILKRMMIPPGYPY